MIRLILLLLLILTSCSTEKTDCSECEKKLEEVLMNMTLPIDLPETKAISENPEESQITAIILENNKYQFEDDQNEYTFHEFKDALADKIDESPFKIKAIKIAGHKFAHYEAIFQVLAFCQANELEPVLAYDK